MNTYAVNAIFHTLKKARPERRKQVMIPNTAAIVTIATCTHPQPNVLKIKKNMNKIKTWRYKQ